MNFIPRLEWNDISIVGSVTSGSAVITSVASTALVKEGMVIDSPYFDDGTRVVSKTVNTVTMDAVSNSSVADQTHDLFHRINFTFPSVKQAEPTYTPNQTVSESQGGVRQVQTNFIAKGVDLEFKMIPVDVMNQLRERFYLGWAAYGNSFRYFESLDEAEFEEFELDRRDFIPQRHIPKRDVVNDGHFLYSLELKFRRVVV